VAIEIFTSDHDRAVLVNTVTDMPIRTPAFDSEVAAEAFLEFCRTLGLKTWDSTDAIQDARAAFDKLPRCKRCPKPLVSDEDQTRGLCFDCAPVCDHGTCMRPTSGGKFCERHKGAQS